MRNDPNEVRQQNLFTVFKDIFYGAQVGTHQSSTIIRPKGAGAQVHLVYAYFFFWLYSRFAV